MFTPAGAPARPASSRAGGRWPSASPAGGGVRRLDDDAVLLRCSADPAAERGRRPPVPRSGPYAVEEYRPDDRITIRRNRYYGGDRVHHVDGFDVDLHANSPEEVLGRIEAGRADGGYTLPQPAFLPSRRLIDKYGINYSRFWVTPG